MGSCLSDGLEGKVIHYVLDILSLRYLWDVQVEMFNKDLEFRVRFWT